MTKLVHWMVVGYLYINMLIRHDLVVINFDIVLEETNHEVDKECKPCR